jgi:hypothetical protein
VDATAHVVLVTVDLVVVGVLVLVEAAGIMVAKLVVILLVKAQVEAVLHTDLNQVVLRIFRLGLVVDGKALPPVEVQHGQ